MKLEAPMGTEVANLDAFKGGPSQAFRAVIPQTDDRMADGIGQSYGIIGYKGKVWSLRFNGETHMVIRPDDGSPLSYIDVVILDSAGAKSRSYFKDFVEGTSEAPLCTSADGVTPDVGVPAKQADACALCPRNVWQTGENGRRSRDCSEFKRLGVLLSPNISKPLLGDALLEAVFLRVPAGSLTNLLNLHKTMHDGLGYNSWEYVTRIDFDPTQAFPRMRFTAHERMPDSSAAMIAKMKQDPQLKRILGEDVDRKAIASPGVTAAVTEKFPSKQPQMIEATAITPASTLPDPAAAMKEYGFGDVSVTNGNVAQTTTGSGPVVPVDPAADAPVVDTGEPQEADAAMDALIKQLTAKTA